MKNFLKQLPAQLFAVLSAVVVTASVASTALAAPGPAGRPTMTWNGDDTKGADHVVFNSFTNNPVWGDERDFMRGVVLQRDQNYVDPVNDVKDGDTVSVLMFVHNNADSALNADGSGIAQNTTVKAAIPTSSAKSQDITGSISADNATPVTVTDTVTFNGANAFGMQYVPGSVHISGNHIDQDLPDADITKGVKIGDNLDGKFKGCFEFIQYVKFKVKIVKPALTVVKTERLYNSTDKTWVKDMTAKPGDTIEYRIQISNTGTTDLHNVTVGDRLPPYLTYVAGSTRLYSSIDPASGTPLPDGIVPGAFNLNRTFKPDSNVFIAFQAKVSNDITAKECGDPRLRNVALSHADEVPTDVEATADVTVHTGKGCDKPATLPSTGAGSTIAIFAAASAAGAAVYQFFVRRRASN